MNIRECQCNNCMIERGKAFKVVENKELKKRCVNCKAVIANNESFCDANCNSTEWEYFK